MFWILHEDESPTPAGYTLTASSELTDEEVRKKLSDLGWAEADIAQAFITARARFDRGAGTS